jgi:hypothetical protein
MAKWKELCGMLSDEHCSAFEILAALPMPPSRMKRLLNGKRLLRHLVLMDWISRRRRDFATERASRALMGLADSERAETRRRACLDLLEQASEQRRLELQEQMQRVAHANTFGLPPKQEDMAALRDGR